jgi:hypothetical protein
MKSLKLRNIRWWLHGIDVSVCRFSQYKAPPPPKGYGFWFVAKRGEGQYVHLEFVREVVLCKGSV